MAKKQKSRKKKPKHYVPRLTPNQYERYFHALEAGEVSAHEQQAVYWDLGPGERPDKVLADMRYVARKEKIPVIIDKTKGRSLVLVYTSQKPETMVRIKRDDHVLNETYPVPANEETGRSNPRPET